MRIATLTLTATLLLGASADAPAQSPTPEERFAPIAALVGHCWTAPMGDSGAWDEQCYEWVYDHAFVRSNHIVRGGKGIYQGSTIFSWDGRNQRLRYHYFTSTGAVSEGVVEVVEGVPVFVETHVDPEGKEIRLRSELRMDGDQGYTVETRRLSETGDGPVGTRRYTLSEGANAPAPKSE